MKNKKKSPVLHSTPIFILILFLVCLGVFLPSVHNYFVGDDFTWLYWSAECYSPSLSNPCENILSLIGSYFTEASGFFYRPGTKIYFFTMYALFGVNYIAYHVVSLFLHFGNAILVFFLGERIFKQKLPAFIAALLFLILSVHSETVFWISSVNHLAAAFFALLGLVSYISFQETKKQFLLCLSLIAVYVSPLFHELGIIAPVLVVGYSMITVFGGWGKIRYPFVYAAYLTQIPMYLFLRYIAKSHWSGGDYSYSLVNLPFNIVGNTVGYIGLILGGSDFLSFYTQVRSAARDNVTLSIAIIGTAGLLTLTALYAFRNRVKQIHNTYVVSLVIFLMPLLPFLALGNITYRYSYLASIGLLFIVLLLVRDFLRMFSNKKRLVIGTIVVGMGLIFAGYNILTLMRIATDWRTAGNIARDVQAVAAAEVSENSSMQVYFVNTPIRYGEAWVFPVGLHDAVWHATRGRSVTVSQVLSVDEACDVTNTAMHEKIFLFSVDNRLIDVTNDCDE